MINAVTGYMPTCQFSMSGDATHRALMLPRGPPQFASVYTSNTLKHAKLHIDAPIEVTREVREAKNYCAGPAEA